MTKSALVKLDIGLPPLPTQQKIATILSTYDDLIENNTRRIKILEDMAQTLYREWFVHFRFPGHENIPMIESELGRIPQGWEICKLGKIAESVRRNLKKGQLKQKTIYIGLEHLPRKSIALSNWEIVDSINSAKLIFNRYEILFGKIRPYLHKVVVAPVDGICSSDTIVIRPLKKEYFGLILSNVFGDHFIDYATAISQGTRMPRADWKVLAEYQLFLPPTELMYQFNRMIQNIINKIHNIISINANLQVTRDLLLPKLISGQIDVSNMEIDTQRLQDKSSES